MFLSVEVSLFQHSSKQCAFMKYLFSNLVHYFPRKYYSKKKKNLFEGDIVTDMLPKKQFPLGKRFPHKKKPHLPPKDSKTSSHPTEKKNMIDIAEKDTKRHPVKKCLHSKFSTKNIHTWGQLTLPPIQHQKTIVSSKNKKNTKITYTSNKKLTQVREKLLPYPLPKKNRVLENNFLTKKTTTTNFYGITKVFTILKH